MGMSQVQKTTRNLMIQGVIYFRGSTSGRKFDSRLDGVDVYVTSECILLCILCMVTQCLFWDVSIMYLSHVIMPRCSNRED